MVVEEREGTIAIVSDGSGSYLVVDIIGKADTYSEAKEIMEEELEEPGEEDDEEDDYSESD